MSTMSQMKRKLEDREKKRVVRPKKRSRKQREYHSSSEDSDVSENEFAPVNLDESDEDQPEHKSNEVEQESEGGSTGASSGSEGGLEIAVESSASEDEDQDEEVDGTEPSDKVNGSRQKRTTKRNDPEAFSTSISKILSTKLSQSARKDPLLSRSREATETTSTLANERLERRAQAKLRAEKKEKLERGRVRDVLGLESGIAGEVAEEEKRLRKIAQRGVVKLFNAVRAAQIRGEQAAKEERKKGTVGMTNREEKVNEMTKQGFLDFISSK